MGHSKVPIEVAFHVTLIAGGLLGQLVSKFFGSPAPSVGARPSRFCRSFKAASRSPWGRSSRRPQALPATHPAGTTNGGLRCVVNRYGVEGRPSNSAVLFTHRCVRRPNSFGPATRVTSFAFILVPDKGVRLEVESLGSAESSTSGLSSYAGVDFRADGTYALGDAINCKLG